MTLSAPAAVHAEELESILPYVVDNHDRVKADEARLSAARNRATEAIGDWFPQVSQTANFGHENQNNEASANTRVGFSEYDLSLTQLLWDFGSTNAAVDKARLQVEEARYNLQDTRLSLMTEAINAYMNVIRDYATLEFARKSEENIRQQTGLEEALVGLGSGFSTDVLQAKSELARAQARRVQNDGSLTNSLNRYKAVFGRMPDHVPSLEPVSYPAPFLPQSLNQALDIAFESNPALKNAILASDIAREDVRAARADNFAPRIEATGERKFKRNVGGTLGSEQETLAKIEMTFDFNLGFTAINTLRASNDDLTASTYTAADTRRTIEEDVRNAWQQLESASLTAAHLNNQAIIEEKFLELARNERQLGNRTLKEVLDSETKLFNAKADALSSETDVLIAAYSLLSATGQLNYNVLRRSKGIKAPMLNPEGAPTADLPLVPKSESNLLEDRDTGRSASDMLAMFSKADFVETAAQETVSESTASLAAAPDTPVVQDSAIPDPASAWHHEPTNGDINPYNVNNFDDHDAIDELAQDQPDLTSTVTQGPVLPAVADTAVDVEPAIEIDPELVVSSTPNEVTVAAAPVGQPSTVIEPASKSAPVAFNTPEDVSLDAFGGDFAEDEAPDSVEAQIAATEATEVAVARSVEERPLFLDRLFGFFGGDTPEPASTPDNELALAANDDFETVEARDEEPETQVAALPRAESTPQEQTHVNETAEEDGGNPISNFFSFLENAHQRFETETLNNAGTTLTANPELAAAPQSNSTADAPADTNVEELSDQDIAAALGDLFPTESAGAFVQPFEYQDQSDRG